MQNITTWQRQGRFDIAWEICLSSIRDFKQSTTAGATTAAVTKRVWGEYVSVVC